jgi:hypothetical protein
MYRRMEEFKEEAKDWNYNCNYIEESPFRSYDDVVLPFSRKLCVMDLKEHSFSQQMHRPLSYPSHVNCGAPPSGCTFHPKLQSSGSSNTNTTSTRRHLHTPNTTMPSPPPSQDVKRKAAREVIDILFEIATLLVRPLLQSPLQCKHNNANNSRTRASTASNSLTACR